MRALGRRVSGDERGSVLIEFAASSILLMTVVFGIIEFSLMTSRYSIVSNGAREGARYASMRGANSGRTATTTTIAEYVVGRSAGVLAAEHVTVTWPVNNKTGSIVRVMVDYPFTPLSSLLPMATINLRSTTQMTIVR